ncbi:hypothetical protein GW17_00004484 [Ensete ventricosum]|nr:hypothetical protein GW17_00004484 [Ensete ventricosum]
MFGNYGSDDVVGSRRSSLGDSPKGSGSLLGTCREIVGRRPYDSSQKCWRTPDWLEAGCSSPGSSGCSTRLDPMEPCDPSPIGHSSVGQGGGRPLHKENGEILMWLDDGRHEAGSGVVAGKEESDLTNVGIIKPCKAMEEGEWVGSPASEMDHSRQRAPCSPLWFRFTVEERFALI